MIQIKVNPLKYKTETNNILGRLLNHDDSVNDRAEGTKLSNSSEVTSRLWRDTFGVDFRQPGDTRNLVILCRVF